ncbi:hypothetical protein Kpol_1023p87 [Vanderwaltozyma polyspora DSM 70294]|uniref:Leucine carboxyl methyltransferase 1 n=1 Tax=Vanderwaltozyma polyspora (strain ATCC 22028 / DSM 70294 / BCRC 21397 / CBS 2163 / NBRC 10782 / NRRL Y-8283 / UCD 57-17) TaxID=436907 RepID=A7TFV8_VANPO|nr:uncharacterized protein Kpol_1023p87 [Vanderwaltozyma polyspora DSM 70294]EDO18916.1 hypothetical protein Kpol_1023p87 [Vanderwaltozyma polyspora DSM 70294]
MERIVQQTDLDALSCKMAAVSKGYLPSKELQENVCGFSDYKTIHLEYFKSIMKNLGRRAQGQINRSLQSSFPVMNYGTYLRTISIDMVLHDYISNHNDDGFIQIVNLGCGSDLRMIPLLSIYPNMSYIDIDYEPTIKLKGNLLGNSEFFGKVLPADRYRLLSCDLSKHDEVINLLKEVTDLTKPTIFITECALCYLKDDDAQLLINSLISTYRKAGLWISYDPIGGGGEGPDGKDDKNDRFGKIMQSNLRETRSLEMPTLLKYRNKDSYSSRFKQLPDVNIDVRIQNLWEYFTKNISDEEKQRLKGLQFLDEIEELQVMQSHYVLLSAQW